MPTNEGKVYLARAANADSCVCMSGILRSIKKVMCLEQRKLSKKPKR